MYLWISIIKTCLLFCQIFKNGTLAVLCANIKKETISHILIANYSMMPYAGNEFCEMLCFECKYSIARITIANQHKKCNCLCSICTFSKSKCPVGVKWDWDIDQNELQKLLWLILFNNSSTFHHRWQMLLIGVWSALTWKRVWLHKADICPPIPIE